MIHPAPKSACCGCAACVQRCPKQCIRMEDDSEGFLYPRVDAGACIDCHLCERVCLVLHSGEPREPQGAFAATNPDERVRMASSSGGVFSLLAGQTIAEGGVVFGAAFNGRWEVEHTVAETMDEVGRFRGSKYVQSRIGDAYRQAERLLKEGRAVLFSGTPCQVAALRRYLRKDYEHLLCVDFICHGAPSPGVFRTYLRDVLLQRSAARQGGGKNSVLPPCFPLVADGDGFDATGADLGEIKSVAFRDKRNGWQKYGFALHFSEASADGEKYGFALPKSRGGEGAAPSAVALPTAAAASPTAASPDELYEPLDENPFMRGFLADLYLRPSCHHCPAKGLRSGSDVTLGDFWGIQTLRPDLNDNRGLSAVTANTPRGLRALRATAARLTPVALSDIAERNPALVRSSAVPKNRARFFRPDGCTLADKVRRYARPPFSWRALLSKTARRVLPKGVFRLLRAKLHRKP